MGVAGDITAALAGPDSHQIWEVARHLDELDGAIHGGGVDKRFNFLAATMQKFEQRFLGRLQGIWTNWMVLFLVVVLIKDSISWKLQCKSSNRDFLGGCKASGRTGWCCSWSYLRRGLPERVSSRAAEATGLVRATTPLCPVWAWVLPISSTSLKERSQWRMRWAAETDAGGVGAAGAELGCQVPADSGIEADEAAKSEDVHGRLKMSSFSTKCRNKMVAKKGMVAMEG